MIGLALTGLVAAIHLWIVVMEMLLWQSALVRKVFHTTPEFAAGTRVMAANQGLYNGFLVAGLVLSLLQGISGAGQGLAIFILSCVMVAGLFGAVTVSRRILYVQTVPAAAALMALLTGV